MARWRIITFPLLTILPFGLAGLIGARHTPSTLPPCLETVESVDFSQSPIDGLWVRQIEISNCGGEPITLDDVMIDGAGHAAGFSVMGPTTGSIDVDTPLRLTVGFTPERVGTHSGALRVAAGGRSLVEVDLLGEGIQPAGSHPGVPCGATLPGGFVARGTCSEGGPRLIRATHRLIPSAGPRGPGAGPSDGGPPSI